MKNIIIKSIFALLLLIEFYPIESNSQTVKDIKDCYIYNSGEEQVYENSGMTNSGFPEFQEADDLYIENSIPEDANEDADDVEDISENANADVYDENDDSENANADVVYEDGDSDDLSEDANTESSNRFEGLLSPSEYFYYSGKDGLTQVVRFVLIKY